MGHQEPEDREAGRLRERAESEKGVFFIHVSRILDITMD